MANYKNKAYANTKKGTSVKDAEGYWYHQKQTQAQDKLIKQWLQSSGKKLSNTKGWRASL